MKVLRWVAIVLIIVMSLMDLPFAFDSGDTAIAKPLAWAVSLLGVLGIIAAVGFIMRTGWGRPAVLAVGAINAIGGVISLVNGMEGAVIGLVISALVVVFGLLATDTRRPVTASA